MTVARVITRPIADVIEQLDLDGDTIVTLDRLASVMDEVGATGSPRTLAYELQREGWLGTLRSRGACEFLPAARAGALFSGDRSSTSGPSSHSGRGGRMFSRWSPQTACSDWRNASLNKRSSLCPMRRCSRRP